jgi:hypothetical protein
MCSFRRALRTPSLGVGHRMGSTPPVRLIEFNSKAPSSCSVMNSFGKHKWRTNARSLPGFWCKIKFLRRTTYKREDGHTKQTVCCATVPLKPASTYAYVALLLRRFGIKSSPRKTSLNYNSSSLRPTPSILEHGGKRRQGRCLVSNAEDSMG